MKFRRVVFIFAFLLLFALPLHAGEDWRFVGEYSNRYKDSKLWWEQFDSLLREQTDHYKAYLGYTIRPRKGYLSDALSETALGIPEGNMRPKVLGGGRWIFAGCRPHSCGEKAFVWGDAKKKIFFFAHIHYFLDQEESVDLLPMLLYGSK